MFRGITTILFDIDNTLLQLNEQKFIAKFLELTYKRFIDLDISFEEYKKYVFKAMKEMITFRGDRLLTNAEVFAESLSQIGVEPIEIRSRFLKFYQEDLDSMRSITAAIPFANDVVQKAAGRFEVVAATDPLFPEIANRKRLQWAGIRNISWLEITSAENYHVTKPHIEYYKEILSNINITAEECLMIGNDPMNDIIAGEIEIKTYLVENNIDLVKVLNFGKRGEKSYQPDFRGTLENLLQKIPKGKE